MQLKTSIIPIRPTFAKVNANHELHLEAICVFAAIGFFLDQDTYWKDRTVLRAATQNTLDANGVLIDSKPWFKWHYTPREISFKQTLDEFTNLFETIIEEQTKNKTVILPLSGGLDSRTQAAALKHLNAKVNAYSYEFQNGYPETKIARQIARACNFNFSPYTINKGYLWNVIDELAELNQCYSDFTSPRQMAAYDEFKDMGDVFSLGHWGDVLFDDMNVDDDLSFEEQVQIVIKKLLKKGGLELAEALWESWELNGSFIDYFYERIHQLLKKIVIPNSANAQIRAFKSLYWAPRWTSVNLAIFKSQRPISLPYYEDRMCQFICTVPEAYLKNRQLQIAYIKKRAPALAKITWQDQRPYNLNNFHLNRLPYNLPYKINNKLVRILKKTIGGASYIQRNWELQFLGGDNSKLLHDNLLNSGSDVIIPKNLIETYFNRFTNKNALQNAHAINMLLVLAKFKETQNHG